MQTIHWVGTGLSAIPGIKKLIQDGHQIIVWNRTVQTAKVALQNFNVEIQEFSMDKLKTQLNSNDILVSMLPGEWHVPLANLCLEKKSHFVSSSYISPEMLDLNQKFIELNFSCVNEVGLDPVIDHAMAHYLV